MAIAGRVLIMPKGAYSASETYEMLDMVNHNGISWLAKKTVTGIEPSNANNEYWHNMLDISIDNINKLGSDVDELKADVDELNKHYKLLWTGTLAEKNAIDGVLGNYKQFLIFSNTHAIILRRPSIVSDCLNISGGCPFLISTGTEYLPAIAFARVDMYTSGRIYVQEVYDYGITTGTKYTDDRSIRSIYGLVE